MFRFALLLAASTCLLGMGADRPPRVADKPESIDAEVLLAFVTDQCNPGQECPCSDVCERMLPGLESIEQSGHQVGIINVDLHGYLAEMYNLRALPTLIAFDENGVCWRESGWRSEQYVREELGWQIVGVRTEKELREQLDELGRTPDVNTRPASPRGRTEGRKNLAVPGVVNVERLLRVTYRIPGGRAKALLDFLEKHSECDFHAIIKKDRLVLTAHPTVHEALAPFINILLRGE